tara:strand:+ start:2087 stop:3823 length:1737 start_codon:yes stop_codon:yes gene_type:complete
MPASLNSKLLSWARTNNSGIVGDFILKLVKGKIGIFNLYNRSDDHFFKNTLVYDDEIEDYVLKDIHSQNQGIDILTNLEGINQSYDYIIANIPINLKLQRPEKLIQKGITMDWQLIHDIMLKMKEGSQLISTVTNSYFSKNGEKFRSLLSENNIHTIAAFKSPMFSIPNTLVRPQIIINKKGDEPNHYFMASIDGISNVDNILKFYANNESKYEDEDTTFGVFTDKINFKGIDFLNKKIYLRRLKIQYPDYHFSTLGDEAVIFQCPVNKKFENKKNCIYIRKSGNSKVIKDLHITDLKHHNYFQIQFGNNIINYYAEKFYQSEIGNAIIDLASRGNTISFINKDDLYSMEIAIPPINVQNRILETYDKIDELDKELTLLKDELSINPDNTFGINRELTKLNKNLKAFTASDKIKSLIRQSESNVIEFKETYGINSHHGGTDKKMREEVLIVINSFINTDGGFLIVGIHDNGEIIGLERDLKANKNSKDEILKNIANLIKDSLDAEFNDCITYEFVNVEEKDLLMFKVEKSFRDCFINGKKYYYRTNPASILLEGKQLINYIKRRKAEARALGYIDEEE